MIVTQRSLAALAVLVTLLAAGSARAYRPFDQTDADVAATGDFELELGPIGFTHDAAGGSYTPGVILNYGVVHRVELVFDAHHALLFGGALVAERRRALDTSLLAKAVLREGCLQGGSGPSFAVEAGVLLPTLPAAGDPGLALTVIGSQRGAPGTIHVDLETDLPRGGTFAFIGGAIIEGPFAWAVRPVAESYFEHETGVPDVISGLGGAIWRAREGLDLDAAVRVARQDTETLYELRAGLTWTVPL